MRLQGKKAVVTGGAGAIGTGICRGLAREGADVAVAYHHSEQKAQALVEEIKALGRNAVAVPVDVRSGESIGRMIDETTKTFGRLDIVVNNAATGPQIPLLGLTEEVIDAALQTNLRGYFDGAGRRPADGPAERARLDRQHQLDLFPIHDRQLRPLRGHQGRDRGDHARLGRGLGSAQHPGQLCRPERS